MTAQVKWDYAVLVFALRNFRGIPESAAEGDETTIHAILREYGAEGWELVSVNTAPVAFAEFDGHILDILYTFKRPDAFLSNDGSHEGDHGTSD